MRSAAHQAALDLASWPQPDLSDPHLVALVLDPWGLPEHLTRPRPPQGVDKPVDLLAARDARVSRCGCGEWRYRARNQHRDDPCPSCGRV